MPLEIPGAASGVAAAGRELCQGEKITGHGCRRPGREYRRQGAAAPGRCLDAAGDHPARTSPHRAGAWQLPEGKRTAHAIKTPRARHGRRAEKP
jgi:hypothetical protein